MLTAVAAQLGGCLKSVCLMQPISSLTCMRCLASLSFRTDGLPLSKIHHAPFDAHLLGIDPDFENDGQMLEC